MADGQVRVPPRWFVTTAWKVHRGIYRATRGRKGLWPPGGKRGWGAMRLTATGRRSGEPRSVIIAYLEDGESLIAMSMNGWGEGDPAWWLNLQANPDAEVTTVDGPRAVRAREAQGEERERLWARFRENEPALDDYAAMRSARAAIVVLEPRPA
jgi:deazaflavin-dependent oxidoreductase (nitroreductase family)